MRERVACWGKLLPSRAANIGKLEKYQARALVQKDGRDEYISRTNDELFLKIFTYFGFKSFHLFHKCITDGCHLNLQKDSHTCGQKNSVSLLKKKVLVGSTAWHAHSPRTRIGILLIFHTAIFHPLQYNYLLANQPGRRSGQEGTLKSHNGKPAVDMHCFDAQLHARAPCGSATIPFPAPLPLN